jgi:NAD+ dependent glucose-6-phosphate dehydrogenase
MPRVLITGAAGRIGREIVDELSGSHELSLIDCRPVPGRATIVADLAKYNGRARLSPWSWTVPRRWRDAFEGIAVVIHLAENPDQEASWQRVLHGNLQVTWNVLQACVQHRVRRVVYASSNWAVKTLELALAPTCYMPDGPKIGSEAQPCPKNPYGIAKACGEMTGHMLVDEQQLRSFVAVRIGWYHVGTPPPDGYYRQLGVGAQDLRMLFRRCVEAGFEGFHVVYGVSAQETAPYDLSYTRRLLSWKPQQLPWQAAESMNPLQRSW